MISDILTAFCPMGCGQHLHLVGEGFIKCLAPKCPDPDAARKILADPETDDIVALDGDGGWSVTHPLRERLTGLLDCPVHKQLSELGAPKLPPAGRYRARILHFGDLEFEQIPD